jgi:zinc protease
MPDAFGGVYTTTPSDLELQLMLSAAYLIHPGYRPEAERRWREAIILSWPRFNADAQSVFASQGARLLTSGDKRFGADPNDGIVDRSFAELKAYLDPILKDAAIEIAIVGDIDEQAAIDAVAKTFGALPKRKPAPAKFRSGRPVVFRQDRTPIRLTHNGEADQALAKLYWHVDFDPEEEPQQARILSILGSVTRLKVLDRVREDLGASYAPSVGFSYSSVYPGLNYVFAGVEARPQDMEKVESALRAIANDLRNGRISQDEFDRALAPSLEQLPSHSASNGYWLSVIAEAQTRPDRMNRMKLEAVEASLRSVTIGDLVEAANRWLRDEDAQLVIVAPLRPGEPKPPSDN